MPLQRPQRITYDIFRQDIEALASQIDTNTDPRFQKKFQAILAVMRGGMVPARFLATLLDIDEMYAWRVQKQGAERQVITDTGEEDWAGKRVLVVEDALETGASMEAVGRELADRGAIVGRAALYHLDETECRPDFTLGEVAVIPSFPWEE